MAGLFRNDPSFSGGKYLVQRRDGTVPEWMYFVIGSADPAAPAALRAYATKAKELGMDLQYVQDISDLAAEFEQYLIDHPNGDPDAPRHREDNPEIIELMKQGRGA